MSALGKQTWYRILPGHCQSTIEIYSPDCEDIPTDARCVYASIHAEETLDEKTFRRCSCWCFWKIKTRENGQTNKQTNKQTNEQTNEQTWFHQTIKCIYTLTFYPVGLIPSLHHIKDVNCFGFLKLGPTWKTQCQVSASSIPFFTSVEKKRFLPRHAFEKVSDYYE